ncbi:acyl carrier protein [Lachnospiraceae bacterium SGI.256]
MTREKIKEQLIELLKEETDMIYDDNQITEESDLQDDLDLSSLELLTIFADIEELFGIELDDDIVMECLSLKELIDYIESMKNE